MLNCIFAALISTLAISFTFGGMTFSSINRSFLRMHKGLFEASVVMDETCDHPYFNEPVLENYLVTYLAQNVGSQVQNYRTNIYYFDAKTGSLCTNHKCDGVKVMLSAEINDFYKYEKARIFTIDSRGEVNE